MIVRFSRPLFALSLVVSLLGCELVRHPLPAFGLKKSGTSGGSVNRSGNVVALEITPTTGKLGLAWSVSRGSSFLLVKRAGDPVTWQPVAGLSYSTGAVTDKETILFIGSGGGYEDSNLTAGTVYHYTLYTYGASRSYRRVASSFATPTGGPILILDAARADGIDSPGSGCGRPVWENLAGGSIEGGVLNGFTNCAEHSGWQGTGSPEDPYRLAFDGVDDYVTINAGPGIAGGNQIGIEMWVRWIGAQTTSASNRGIYGVVLSRQLDQVFTHHLIGLQGPDPAANVFQFQASGCCSGGLAQSEPFIPQDGRWRHVVVTTKNSQDGQQMYVDGRLVWGTSSPGPVYNASRSRPLTLGAWRDADSAEFVYFRGEVALLRVYPQYLGHSQVIQYCREGADRFLGASCP